MAIITSSGLSARDAESTILLTNKDKQISLDFLNTDNVIGMQFDIVFDGVNQKNIVLDSCVSGLSKSHVGRCGFLKNGNLRVLIFSPTNAVLDSGNIGTLNINGKGFTSKRLSFQKVKMVGPKSVEINGGTLIDSGDSNRIKPLQINSK